MSNGDGQTVESSEQRLDELNPAERLEAAQPMSEYRMRLSEHSAYALLLPMAEPAPAAQQHSVPPSPSVEPSGREFERLCAELREARMRIKRQEESLRHLISNMSHELRTPITLIQGYVEAMLEGVITDPDKQRRYLEMIGAKAAGMDRLIANLFQLTELETRQAIFDLQPVLVHTLKDYLRTKFELDFEHAGHRLRITISKIFGEQALFVNVDLGRLDQVFTNLFANAFRHLPQAGGLIDVYFEYLETDLEQAVLIRVKDNGDGIDEKDLPFVFDRFYKGEAARKAGKQGSMGLGLSICEEIVASHGGSIRADSKPGQGAEFFFTLPIAGPERADTAAKNVVEQSQTF